MKMPSRNLKFHYNQPTYLPVPRRTHPKATQIRKIMTCILLTYLSLNAYSSARMRVDVYLRISAHAHTEEAHI